MKDKAQICADCGSREDPVLANRGMLWVEILMWLSLILPGVIYSVWRRARRRWVCSYCGNPSMVSIYSARARSMIALMGNQDVSKTYFKKPMGDTHLKPRSRKKQAPSKGISKPKRNR